MRIVHFSIINLVQEAGDTSEDREARALLNKFLGATVLMSGMESMVSKDLNSITGAPMSRQVKTTTQQKHQQKQQVSA